MTETPARTETDFRIYADIVAFEKSGDDHPLRIAGVVSTDALDADDEVIVQKGLDFAPFLTSGWFNDNHGQAMSDVLGYPTDARFIKKGQRRPDGKIAERPGWWAEGYLVDTERGRAVHRLACALEKGPGDRKLGFSIEGSVVRRDKTNPKRVLQARVKNVAITHCPKNGETELITLAKALTAGSAIAAPAGPSGGDGFALRTESMDVGVANQEQDDEVPVTVTVVLDAPNEPRGEAMTKADAPGEFIDFEDHLSSWASAFQEFDESPDSLLTKAEARVMLRAKRPTLTDEAINQILAASYRRTV